MRAPVMLVVAATGVAAAAPAATTRVLVPFRLGALELTVDPRGSTYAVSGTLRVDVTGDAKLAGDAFGTPIVGWAPVGDDTWVFVAQDGSVARSRGFLGRLERLGEVPRSVTGIGLQHGRVAVVDELGRVWTTDGSRPIERLHTPDGSVMAAAFADAKRGAVVLEGGALWITEDAGATWRQLDLHGAAAVSLDARFGATPADYVLNVATTDGSATVFSTTVAAPPAKVGHFDAEAFIQGHWLAYRQPERLRAGDPHAYSRARGRGGAHDTIERRDYATGKLLATAPLPGTGCTLLPWGPRIVATCDQPAGAWVSADGQSFAALPLGNAVEPANIRWSDDGVHALAEGACAGDDRAVPADRMAVCARRDDGWHTLVIPRDDLRLVHGAHALLSDRALLDLDDGTRTEVPLAHEVDPHASALELQWAGDGALVALVQLWREGSWIVVGPPGGPYAKHRLPIEADRVAFADARRGLVAGKTLGDVWRTRDGGATWEHVVPPVDGDARRIALDLGGGYWRPLEGLQCRDTGCWVGGRLVLDGWGPLVPESRVLLSEHAPLHGAKIWGGIWFGGTQDCTASAPLPVVADRERAGRRERTLFGPQGSATLRLGPGGEIELAWPAGGRSLRGAATLAELTGDDAASSTAVYLLRATTRAGALFERCASRTSRGCTLLWARAGGGVAGLEALRASRIAASGLLEMTGAMPRADGGVIALLEARGRDRVIDVVVSIAPDGAAALRWFAWSDPDTTATRALGRYHGELGFVFGDVHDPQWLRFVPVGRDLAADPINLPWVVPAEGSRCRDVPPTPDDVEVEGVSELDGALGSGRYFGFALVRGRVTGAGICPVEAHSWAYAPELGELAVPTADLHATAGPDGLRGGWTSATGKRTLACPGR